MWFKNQVTLFGVILAVFISLSRYAEGQLQVKVVGKNRLENLATANNEFSFKLLKNLENDKNIFFSPFSIHTALAMLNEGAKGVTSQEIQQVLGYDVAGVNNYDISSKFRELLEIVQNVGEEYQLEVANALLTQSKYPIFEEYVSKIRNQFHAFIKNVNFNEEREVAVREINNWVNERTHGKITKVLKRLESNTKAVILNAVYFKGSWKYPFDENITENLTFYNNGINPVNTPIMKREFNKCMYTINAEGFHAISLPYKGNDIEMIIILPLPDYTLKNIQLSAVKLEEIISKMEESTVIVKLPKFKLEYSRELKEDLKNLGMKQAFTGFANLSGINEDKRLYVASVQHKAVIEVNERGSTAAGSTTVIIESRVAPIQFTCDRPFLFIIRDKRTNMNIFIGEMNEL